MVGGMEMTFKGRHLFPYDHSYSLLSYSSSDFAQQLGNVTPSTFISVDENSAVVTLSSSEIE
jgi:hypothetical protein